MKHQKGSGLIPMFFSLFFFGLFFAAWLTHIVVCLKTAAWGFLIAGAIFFPVGLVHGIGVWFGAW